MQQYQKQQRSFSYMTLLMIGVIFSLQLPMAAQAAMVSTSEVVPSITLTMDRASLVKKFQEEQLQNQMIELGVEPAVVISRVENMTDAEVNTLNEKIQDMPAGEGILGLIVLIFVVFIITDALGATDVFNFVDPI